MQHLPVTPPTTRADLDRKLRLHLATLLVLACSIVACTEGVNRARLPLRIDARTTPLSRICFGSCAKSPTLGTGAAIVRESQAIWNTLLAAKPDVFMWTGDAVYLESEPGTANSLEHKLAVQRRLFERMQTIEPYRRFAAEVPIIGTWDDHDYGLGNAGSEFLGKIESQKNYLDFLREPADSPRRNQAGVYESYTCGPAEKRVKIYLLDTRFHRDAHGPDGDMLGAEQWAWLKSEMASSDAQINVVVSSIQILLRQGLLGEQWFRWSRSRTRLFDLIESSDLSGVVFVTGDKHFGTIEASQEVDLERQVHEIMSSGMTPHSVISGNNLAMVRLWYGRSRVINVPNFGMIEINWNVSPVQVSLQIRDWKNKVHLRTDLVLEGKQLSPSSAGKTGIQK